MKKLITLFLLMFCTGTAFALEVVYPKKTEVTINSPSTFFVGSTNPHTQLTLNGEPVEVHKSGGFAKAVTLETGKNTFTLKSGDETLIYNITRQPTPTVKEKEPILTEYENLKYVTVSCDNAPLRSTPIDGGINRISHLQKGIPLVVDGEQNGFYRVILGTIKEGWIAKSNVKIENSGSSLAEYKSYDYADNNEFRRWVIHLNRKTAWELVERNYFLIKLYNIDGKPNNTYVKEIPLHLDLYSKKLMGYSANFSGTDFIVKIRKPVKPKKLKPLKNIKITIDPGHGGNEVGAIGCLGHKEKDINLDFAKLLIEELQSRGAIVSTTRTEDTEIGLQERVDFANSKNSMIFISLHGNALPDNQDPQKIYGTEIYYYYKQAKPLAESIMNSMTKKLGMKNNGIHQQSLAVVRNTNAVSLLIEIGYLINPSDNAKLINKNFQKKTAKAIADGIENYIKK